MLGDPAFDIALAPDAPGREFADRLRESRSPRDLIGPLSRDTEQGRNLGDAHEFHPNSLYPLTGASVKLYSPLDTVKEER